MDNRVDGNTESRECEYRNGEEGRAEERKPAGRKVSARKASKKKDGIDLEHLTPQESLKLEIAAEIGVYDKVIQGGWKSLTSKESGRIGGIMTKRKKEEQKKEEQERYASTSES